MSRPKPRSKLGGAPEEAVLRKIRIPFVRRAELLHRGQERAVFLVDLGLAGAFVELGEPLPLGDRADVRFALPGNEIPLNVHCRVAWLHARGQSPKQLPAGLGLEFLEISPGDRNRLREHLLDHLRREGGRRRFAHPWPGRTWS